MRTLRLLFFTFFCIFMVPGWAAKNSPERSQSLTIGHQTQTSFQMREFFEAGKKIYSLKTYRDGQLLRAAALTKETYQQIQKDWKFVLPDAQKRKSASAGCDDLVRVEKKIADGVKIQIECRSSWSKTQSVRFDGFLKALRSFANGETPFYQGMQ